MTQDRIDEYEAGIRHVLARGIDTGGDADEAKTALLIHVAVERITAGSGLDRRAVLRVADAVFRAAHRATRKEFERLIIAAAANN